MPAKDYERRTERRLETSGLSAERVESLRTTDPFMYYSIPGVQRDLRRRGHGMSAPADFKTSTIPAIPRRTAISFEVHQDLALDEILNDEESFSLAKLKDLLNDDNFFPRRRTTTAR